MLRWLCLFGLLVVIAPAQAQEAATFEKATLGKLPEVYVLTALKSGEWEDLGDLIGEALDEVDEMADERDLKLSKTEVVIYEMAGLKNFRARIGYLLDPETKAKPAGSARTSSCASSRGPPMWLRASAARRRSSRSGARYWTKLEKPGVKRLKGVETIEIFYGEMDDKETKIEVYGPLR